MFQWMCFYLVFAPAIPSAAAGRNGSADLSHIFACVAANPADNEQQARQDLDDLYHHNKDKSRDRKTNERMWLALHREFVAKHPGLSVTGDVRISIAWSLHRTGDDGAAAKEFDSIASDYKGGPVRARALTHKGYFLQELGKYDEAEKTLRSVIEGYEGTEEAASARLSLAWNYSKHGRIAEADAMCQEVLGKPGASRALLIAARYNPIVMRREYLQTVSKAIAQGQPVSMTLAEGQRMFEDVYAGFKAFIASERGGGLVAAVGEAAAFGQSPEDQQAADAATFDFGLFLIDYERYDEAAEQFQALLNSPSTGTDYIDASWIGLGAAQYYLGSYGDCITSVQTAINDPNFPITSADAAEGWLAAARGALGVTGGVVGTLKTASRVAMLMRPPDARGVALGRPLTTSPDDLGGANAEVSR